VYYGQAIRDDGNLLWALPYYDCPSDPAVGDVLKNRDGRIQKMRKKGDFFILKSPLKSVQIRVSAKSVV